MPLQKLKTYLDKNSVKYLSIRHSPAYTAPEVAEAMHISGENFAKAVIVRVDGELAMVVLPAHKHVDVDWFKSATHAKKVSIAAESEFEERFPECELGAMPPFGNLFGMDVYLAPGLSQHKEIICNAGSHQEVIKLRYDDFIKLVKPKLLKAA